MTAETARDSVLVRSCFHCALGRALRAEAAAFAVHGCEVTLRQTDGLWLPESGARVYRRLRRFLREVRSRATAGPVKLSILEGTGKGHVEVMAVVQGGHGEETVSTLFPRYELKTLWAGFDEGAGAD